MTIDNFKYGYKIDKRIREKYHAGFVRPDADVSILTVHGTAGGNNAESIIKWMLSGGILPTGKFRKTEYIKGVALFQYMIDKDGIIYDLINPHNWVYHSGTGGFDYKTIGVELVNSSFDNSKKYTEKQYHSLFELYCFLSGVFPNLKTIQGHESLYKEKTGRRKKAPRCPGAGFNWASLCDNL